LFGDGGEDMRDEREDVDAQKSGEVSCRA
jgi:hypothetical protein